MRGFFVRVTRSPKHDWLEQILWKPDARSLALFRVGLAGITLAFCLQLVPDFNAFYRDGPHPSFVAFWLFFALPVSTAALAAGWFTRWATALCWTGIMVVQHANPYVLNAGDAILRLLLFWSLFLPLGDAWSLDSRKYSPALDFPLTRRIAPQALLIQAVSIYWSTALLKSDPLWRVDGNALYFVFNLEYCTSSWGRWLLHYPESLRMMTFAAWHFELWWPFLLFVPWKTDQFRLLAIIGFFAFHLVGLQLLMLLGLFQWICAVMWTAFIPSFFWLAVGRWKKIPEQRAIRKTLNSHILDWGLVALAALALLDVTSWNLANLRGKRANQWMVEHDFTREWLRLDQNWNMYAPFPAAYHGWLMVPATLADGSQIDLFTGKKIDFTKPNNITSYLGSSRWRKYLYVLMSDHSPDQVAQYENYLVRRWEASTSPNQKVVELSLVWMKQTTQRDLTNSAPKPEVIDSRNFSSS